MAEEGHPVDLYIYDLTHGFASVLAPAIIGREVEGVWHTAVVAYGREYFYGGGGITSCAPGGTQLGAPHSVERLGQTFVPFQVFVEYIQGLGSTTYRGSAYHLLEHNCNHFSEEVAQFLCGAHVPKHVLQQPDVLPPPHRAALAALLDTLQPSDAQVEGGRHERRDSPDFLTLNHQIEEARVQSAELEQRRSTLADKLARKERRKEKKRKKLLQNGLLPDTDLNDDMSEVVESAPAPVAEGSAGGGSAGAGSAGGVLDQDEREREEALRRARDPPILYRDVDGMSAFEELVRSLEGVSLSAEEQQSVEELRQYLQGEGSWVLGDDFLTFVEGVLCGRTGGEAARAALGAALGAAALRDDVALLLHQDRRRHALLAHAHTIDTLPLQEQRAIALLMCNLFESVSASEWLLYISEWEANGRTLSNIRVTTKVCVHCMLAEDEVLRERGTALLHNLATKEVKTVRLGAGRQLRDLLPERAKSKVFDEVCVELCMAALQLLQQAPSEEHMWRAMRALARLVHHSQEVPQLVALVGPHPSAFRGTSPRIDHEIDVIVKKLK